MDLFNPHKYCTRREQQLLAELQDSREALTRQQDYTVKLVDRIMALTNFQASRLVAAQERTPIVAATKEEAMLAGREKGRLVYPGRTPDLRPPSPPSFPFRRPTAETETA